MAGTTENGGQNSENQKRYLQSLFDKGDSGNKSWAYNQAQQSGVNLDTSGYQKYLQNMYDTGNSGQQSWAKTQNGNYGVQLNVAPDMPQGYDQLASTNQINDYSKYMANKQYQNESLGYQQMIDRYKQQEGQLLNDQSINDKAKQLASLKYADALLQNDASGRDAKANYDNSVKDVRNGAIDAKKSLYTLAFEQAQRAKESLNSRGLYDSTFLNSTLGNINKSQMGAVGNVERDMANNISKLDSTINATMANLNAQKTSLTQRQAEEAASAIKDMMKERDDQKSQYELLINQEMQKDNNSKSNIVANQSKMYQDLYDKNAGLYRQDRSFAEQKAQAERSYQLQLQQMNEARDARAQSQKNWEAEMGIKTQKETEAKAAADQKLFLSEYQGLSTALTSGKLTPEQAQQNITNNVKAGAYSQDLANKLTKAIVDYKSNLPKQNYQDMVDSYATDASPKELEKQWATDPTGQKAGAAKYDWMDWARDPNGRNAGVSYDAWHRISGPQLK